MKNILTGPCRCTNASTSIAFRKAALIWSSEAFFRMRKVSFERTCASLLSAVDSGMQAVYAQMYGDCHWSNHTVEDMFAYSYSPVMHDLDVTERGHRDLLGHMIELGLTSQVEISLKADPEILKRKQGRPYLDYALRYKTDSSAEPKHPEELESAFAMVKMLLEHNLDVNQKVEIHGGRTVWEFYVYSIFDSNSGDEWHRKIAWLLIDHGPQHTDDRVWSVDYKKAPRSNSYDDVVEAALEKSDQHASYSVVYMLKELFSHDEARAMQKAIMANGQNQSW